MEDTGSPKWIRPCERLRLRKKAKRQLQLCDTILQPIDTNVGITKTDSNIGQHERNPFRKSPKKQRLLGNDENNSTQQSRVFKWMTKMKNHNNLKEQLAMYESYLPMLSQCSLPVPADILDENTNLCPPNTKNEAVTAENEDKEKRITDIPVDWSLKTKVRFMSPNPFPWQGNLKTAEEASGTTSYVRCLQLEKEGKKHLDSTPGARFYKQCLYWIHPSLPWLQLFPRMDTKRYLKKAVQSTTSLSENIIQDALHTSWCASLESLYQLLRARQCPFFYLCASTFTILFRAAGISGISEINAMFYPTTRGMRQALIDEGIGFTMPLKERKSGDTNIDTCSQMSCTSDESVTPGDSGFLEEEKNDSGSDDEEPGTWLESLGLSQSDFPALNPKKIKLEKEGGKYIDHHPQSLVYVYGADTPALLNFLINTKLCFTKTGPLAGVPPTLISPVAFKECSLQSLKIHQGSTKYKGQTQHVVELTGPIIPSTVRGLCSLFNLTQNKTYTASFVTHQPTAVFCSVPPARSTAPSVFAIENLKDCGQSKDTLEWMCSMDNTAKTDIGQIVASNGVYAIS